MNQNLIEFPVANDRHAATGESPQPQETETERSLRRYMRVGIALSAGLVAGVGGWLMLASISSAVIAPGQVVVESSSRVVQHAEGGIVGEIAVRDGDQVDTGGLLVRLDGTAIKANLAIIIHQMNEMTVRKVRLLAERDGAELLQFPASLGRQLTEDGGLELIRGEDKLFQARRETLLGQRTLLQERITQIRDEIAGMESQGRAIMHELRLTTEELDALRDLKKRQLVSLDRYMPLERGAAKLEGSHGQIVSDIARARGRISEAELQIIQLEKEFRESVLSDLGTVRVSLAELTERRIAAEDQLRRLEIRAPQAGIVHQLALHTRGGVIAPGQALMEIIPQDEGHIVEARIAPGDIDQVRQGQEAVVRFSSFNQRTTPQLEATLYSVSPDIAEDERSGEQYYIGRLRLNNGELERLDGLSLTPGMPADVFIQTGARSAMSYLTKPFTDQLRRAFREE